jgi:Protein of unknown function (DUF3999)
VSARFGLALRIRRGAFVVGVIGAALLAAFAVLAATPLPAAWKHWHYSRVITLPTTGVGQFADVVAPPDLYTHTDTGLADLRVIDDRGAEIPYVIFQHVGSSKSYVLPTTLRENSFTAGGFTQLVLDAGVHAPFHNSVRIETGAPDFIEWVQVEASDDGHVWRMVEERAPIFRFRKNAHEGTQVVHYSENNARYLRVRILDGDKKFQVSDAQILLETTEPEERVPLEVAMVADAKQPVGRSVWSAGLGAVVPLVTDVRFEVGAPPEFIRSVDISSSAGGKDWNSLKSAEIYRYRRGDTQQEQLAVAVSTSWGLSRYLRVEILNGNDARLAVAAPKLYVTPQHIAFEQQPGRSYRLIYGQERAEGAEYDLVRRVNVARLVAVAAQLGPEEVNAAWVDPRPWTETHEVFLWGVLLIAVIVIGFTAIQSMRRAGSSPDA